MNSSRISKGFCKRINSFGIRRGMSGRTKEFKIKPPKLPKNEPGVISIKMTQRKFNIDKEKTRLYVSKILEILEMEDYGVDITICSDSMMRKLYLGGKGKSKSTDVLAFATIGFSSPGVISNAYAEERFLGRIFVCPAYVSRQMEYDQYEHELGELDTSTDDGVSLAMATTFSVPERIPMLLVHSMIHLVGYDHETDEEWAQMVSKENEVLLKLSAAFPEIKLPAEILEQSEWEKWK